MPTMRLSHWVSSCVICCKRLRLCHTFIETLICFISLLYYLFFSALLAVFFLFLAVHNVFVSFPTTINKVNSFPLISWSLQAPGPAGVLHQAQIQPRHSAGRLPRHPLPCPIPGHVHTAGRRPRGTVCMKLNQVTSHSAFTLCNCQTTNMQWKLKVGMLSHFSGNEG